MTTLSSVLPVIIGFQQLHYKVKEGDGCVTVCVEVLAGEIKSADSASFRFNAVPLSAGRKLISLTKYRY